MTDEQLKALSDAATPGPIRLNTKNRLCVLTSMDHPMCEFSDPFHRQFSRGEGRDPEFMVALWNAYRSGQLVKAVPECGTNNAAQPESTGTVATEGVRPPAAPTPRTEAAWDKQVNDLSGGSAQDYERAWYAMREIARQLERELADMIEMSATGPTAAELEECFEFWQHYSSINEGAQDDLAAERNAMLEKMQGWLVRSATQERSE